MRYNYNSLLTRLTQLVGKPDAIERDGRRVWKWEDPNNKNHTELVLSTDSVFCAAWGEQGYDGVFCAFTCPIRQIDDVTHEKVGKEEHKGFICFSDGDGAVIGRVIGRRA